MRTSETNKVQVPNETLPNILSDYCTRMIAAVMSPLELLLRMPPRVSGNEVYVQCLMKASSSGNVELVVAQKQRADKHYQLQNT